VSDEVRQADAQTLRCLSREQSRRKQAQRAAHWRERGAAAVGNPLDDVHVAPRLVWPSLHAKVTAIPRSLKAKRRRIPDPARSASSTHPNGGRRRRLCILVRSRVSRSCFLWHPGESRGRAGTRGHRARLHRPSINRYGDLGTLFDEGGRRRRHGQSRLISQWSRGKHPRPGLSAQRAADITWALTGPELYSLLVLQSGWNSATYEQWLIETLHRQLFNPDTTTPTGIRSKPDTEASRA
jgi:hypothetical protein